MPSTYYFMHKSLVSQKRPKVLGDKDFSIVHCQPVADLFLRSKGRERRQTGTREFTGRKGTL